MLAAVARRAPDAAIFLGDGVRDAEALARRFPALPLRILRGNCDWYDVGGDERALFTFGGVRIFAAHGHDHRVKYGLEAFATSVLCSGAKLGLYGHTHAARLTRSDGLELLNPGSVGSLERPTYGRVEAENGVFKCTIVDIMEETEGLSPHLGQETER